MRKDESSDVAVLERCSKRRGSILAVDDLSLSIPPGRVVALLGPNGAGKSTSIALLTGQLRQDRGQARLFGEDPKRSSARELMGVMLQMAGLPSQLTIVEQIRLFSGYYPSPRPIEETIAMAGLESIESRRCRMLSGGQQRRLQFALAVCGRPRLLVLDEPTTGLDSESRRLFWNSVRAEVAGGVAVLLTTHMLEEADALADHIVVLEGGRILTEGSPSTIKAGVGGSSIRCRTAVAEAELMRLPGVQRCAMRGGLTTIVTTEAPSTLRHLLALDEHVHDIGVSGASLDDAFASMMSARVMKKAA